MNKIIIITGASSGFGRLTANALARSGHTVYASMRETTGRNAPQAADVRKFAEENRVDLRPIELDVLSQDAAAVGDAGRCGGRFHGHRPYENRYASSCRTRRVVDTREDNSRALSEVARHPGQQLAVESHIDSCRFITTVFT